MTKVKITPGACGLVTRVEATAGKRRMVTVKIDSACPNVSGMAKALGEEFNGYEICMQQPGAGPFYEYAREHFPAHGSCPSISGILKCIEAECRLALKRPASIEFEE
ncbi:MAG: hypothetical protein IJT62_05265 [Oscillospiraceae bacterium]|nr:hypothetical protein [Oscillospiraceae bacterium]